MSRAVVTVATGHYVTGAMRLGKRLAEAGEMHCLFRDRLPAGSPPHSEVPYAFKAAALREASDQHSTLLWADACIYPLRDLAPLWERIEKDGAWIGYNGFTNAEWTADAAYEHLGITKQENAAIPHVVATAFGLSLAHPVGREILGEYCRLAFETRAFCGPWTNREFMRTQMPDVQTGAAEFNGRCGPCGDSAVRGHRHDQTALSVIAWRTGVQLTSSPEIFAYGSHRMAGHDERTLLLADGEY